MLVGDLNLEETLGFVNMESDCKDQEIFKVEVHDVEEGEISDSASVEEISEENFTSKQAAPPPPSPTPIEKTTSVNSDKGNVNVNNGGGARVLTMKDLYKYQFSSRTSYSGLYNLAWAQAVNNKPLDEIFVMMEDNKTKDKKSDAKSSNENEESKIVIDVDDDGEKEEGELEEGEIDMDSDVVVKNEGSNEVIMEENDESVEMRNQVDLMKKELENLNMADAEKSFDAFCSSLMNLTERLKQLVSEGSFAEKDTLVQLLLTAIQNVNSVFTNMNLRLKDQNREGFSRLLSNIISLKPPLFSPPQLKEIEALMSSLDFLANSLSNDNKDKQKLAGNGINNSDSYMWLDQANKDLASANKGKIEVSSTRLLDQSNSSVSSDYLKSGLIKPRGLALPLLDLHKDHDADSLPSPTREVSVPLPFGRPLGHGSLKPEWPVPRRNLGRENSILHPYETDAVKAVSSYQQKFGRSSLYMKDDLPSPTPSEDDSGDCEMGVEVSSSIIHKVNSAAKAPSFGQPIVTSINSSISGQSVVPCTAGMDAIGVYQNSNAGAASTNPNPVSRSSSAKSRDPRLRFANSDAGARNFSQCIPALKVNDTRSEPLGIMSSRKQKTGEDLGPDGPAIKRQRKESTGSGSVYDAEAVTGTGGWLEDRGTVGTTVIDGNHVAGSLFNGLRSLEHSAITSNLTNRGNEKLQVVGQNTTFSSPISSVPVTSASATSLMASQVTSLPASSPFTLPLTIQSMNSSLKDINTTASFHSLLRDIAVNPSILMDILKTEHQKASNNNKSLTDNPKLESVLSATPSTNKVQPNLTMRGQASEGTPSPMIAVEEPGKVRMKPRDPRRVLLSNAPQMGGTAAPDQRKVNALSSSAMPGNLGVLRQDDQLEKSAATSCTTNPPDITREFTNNLKNIADILSVSQASTSAPALSQIPPSQSIPGHQGGHETKGVTAELSNSRKASGLGPAESSTGPPRPVKVNAWGDVEHLFDGFDEKQRAAIHKERTRRLDEQKKLFAARKLCLVLDLDHTLLNSAKFVEVDPVHDDLLRKKEEQDKEKPYRHLFRFPHMGMWTKLRPGIWNFLEKASKLYEMHLYTMGNKYYATEMAKLLDPKGVLFSGRVISRGDDGEPFDGDDSAPKTKDLEGVLGMESGVVIIDDSVRVWPHNKLNLIAVERYIYFPCSRRQFGLPGPSLLEIDHDERPEEGTLASSLAVIEKIHQNFFAHQSLDEADVRNILASEQRKILGGCRIVFSRVFPVGEANPHMHPLWQTAEQFGAVCTNQIDEQVTHVVANSLGTDKVNWALTNGRFVVHPGWVEASALLYRRANEHDFAIKQP